MLRLSEAVRQDFADVWVALDGLSGSKAREILQRISKLPFRVGVKAGLELCTDVGVHAVVSSADHLDIPVFLDLKFKDIPNTMAGAAKAAARYHPHIFNVHASAGVAGMRAAVHNRGRSMVFAVTVLTSIDDYECQKIYGGNVRQTVSHFGMMVVEAGLQGVICSGQDLEVFAEEPGLFDDLYKLTPGVRPTWAPTVGDQKRVVTPRDAIMAGASGIVIGRPVLQPPEGTTIEEAIQLVVREVNQAFEDRGAGPQRAERGAP